MSTSEWISVKDRLPKCNVSVLVWHSKRRTSLIATLYNLGYKTKADHWTYYDVGGNEQIDLIDKTITHWMPLPEPPKIVKQ